MTTWKGSVKLNKLSSTQYYITVKGHDLHFKDILVVSILIGL